MSIPLVLATLSFFAVFLALARAAMILIERYPELLLLPFALALFWVAFGAAEAVLS
jgi:hypothetical protein